MNDQTTPLRDRIAEAALAAVEAALGDTLMPSARTEALAGIAAVLPAPIDRAAALREAADDLVMYLGTAGEAADGEMHDTTILWAAEQLRRRADETAATQVEAGLADGPVRCPLCPTPLLLHTPSGARAHFTTVHPEQRITGRGAGPWPLLVADETAATETQPRRGDQFEAWLKQQRDDHRDSDRGQWTVLNDLLDRYRLHADTGTPLGEHVCEGQVVGDCECLEQPAAGARQDGAQP